MSTSRKALVTTLAALMLAVPAATCAYTLVFKDGSTLVVEDKYHIEGDRLLATLLSGTVSFFNLGDVDLDKTDEMNTGNLGNAMVLDGQNARPLDLSDTSSPRTLADLVRERGANQGIFSKPTSRARIRRTPTGNLDLFNLPSESYATEEVNEQVLRLLRRHGVAGAVRRGSEEGRLLVLVTTNTRGEVFAALTGSADAMVELLDQLPHLQFLELAMSTNNRSRAAMFLLGYEDAVALADGKVEPGAFFADNVLF